jgi:hypothetical protein
MPVTALPSILVPKTAPLLHHLLEADDTIGRDALGQTVIQLTANDWLLDQLMLFDAGSEDFEDGSDAEDDAATREIIRGKLLATAD